MQIYTIMYSIYQNDMTISQNSNIMQIITYKFHFQVPTPEWVTISNPHASDEINDENDGYGDHCIKRRQLHDLLKKAK